MILVLIPNKRNQLSEVSYLSALQQFNMMQATPHLEVHRDFRGPGDAAVDPYRDEHGMGDVDDLMPALKRRVAHTAPIRQAMIDDYLKDEHSHVLWIDADVIDYSPRLPVELLNISGKDIVAPSVILDCDGDLWYDTAGFIEDGKWCSQTVPYFKQIGPVVELDGVGCVYMVPADVYRNGAKHVAVDGFTDHLAICQAAREQGLKVLCDTQQAATHADFRKYLPDPHQV